MKRAFGVLLLASTVFVSTAGPSGATTFRMMRDADLHDQSSVVARVEVLTVSSAPAFGAPSTDYIVLVERLLKGRVSGATVVVRVPGGIRADGIGLEVHGAPHFAEGDRALLFLSPRADGTYGIQHLMLGAFVQAGSGEHRAAVRRLEGAHGAGAEDDRDPDIVRDWHLFELWLADRSAGRTREPDYFAARMGVGGSVFQSSLLEFESNPIRFFEFDQGGKVVWRVGRGLSGAKKAFKRAAKVWNGDPSTIVDLEPKGRTSSRSGFTRSDGVNAILFDDPNEEVEGAYSCSRGGVIAVGGSWFFQSPAMVRRIPGGIGKGKANVAVEADIITNDGTRCLFADRKASEQVFGHELGHTLGLGHSCESSDCAPAELDALMWAYFHDDGRGAQLGSWDRRWLGKLY